MTDKHLSDTLFDSLDLPSELLQGIEAAGFKHCTPIQAKALPLALGGKDVAGQAQTGTGKSAAFLIALFNRLMRTPPDPKRRANQPRALVLAPTRELAIQIHSDAETLGARTGLSLGLVYGGTGYESQRNTLQTGVDVLIGTPGRIIDYFKQHVFDLRACEAMVLDEADRMFDLGFIKDVRFLLRRMPPPEQRLNMLFSATLSMRVMELAYEHMNNPELVEVEPERVTSEGVRERVYYPANHEKIRLLVGLMRKLAPARSIVFINTKRAADMVWSHLEGNGIHAAVLSGDVPQTKRQSLLAGFARGDLPVLVATDVAARGLHIPAVSHVFNFDLPQDAEDYVHRIGRTARAGASGEAISFACETYAFSLMDIEQYIGHKIPVESIDEDLLADLAPPVRRPRREARPQDRGRGGEAKGNRRDGRRSGGRRRTGGEPRPADPTPN
ncbi:ATP-dependent RNA helicase RhlB [Ectothiorhodospiraceae bacterium 2226]|nr:ATP-dependent RNA helicase RhlB [Ectothiorhodospiraceae bacterium 2226]